MTMYREDMVRQNPWWKDPVTLGRDIHLRELDESPVRWRPMVGDLVDTSTDRIYTLRGPRQVGKTTLLKGIVREALGPSTDPMAILYLSCDLVRDGRELVELIDMYLELSGRVGPDQHRLLLLDEITSVEDWERGVKHLADTGRLEASTLVLTGSSSIDLKRSSERLPGRRGEGATPVNVTMLPARFREYVATVAPDLARDVIDSLQGAEHGRAGILEELMKGQVDPILFGEVQIHLSELRQVLDGYKVTGGFMRPTREMIMDGEVTRGTYDMYVSSLIGDLTRWGLGEDLARQVVRAVVDRMTTPFSLNSIAQVTEVGSHNTVSKYLEALEDSYAVVNVHSLDMHEGRPSYRRPRKTYFLDPFIYHALRAWSQGSVDPFSASQDHREDAEEGGRLAEMLVAGHLMRLVSDLHPSDLRLHHEMLLHWRKKRSDREVDFVLAHDGGHVPVEVKYQRSISDGDLRNMRPFKQGVLVSRDELAMRRGFAVVPLELFLFLV